MENLVNEKNSFERIFSLFERKLEELGAPLPSVSLIAAEDNDPYRILASTIISLRTRDAVTLSASMRLFESFPDIKSLKEGDISKIEEAIKPAGFYRRKAQQLKTIARIIYDEYGGKVPYDIDKLMELPGVGIKTASLVLNLGYGIDAICVDCHVHQIANRLGWVDTSSPEETEKVMRKILPRRYWIPLNEMLVRYGQHVCLPVSPLCSSCPADADCPKKGVASQR